MTKEQDKSDTPRTEKAREQYWMDVYEPNPTGFSVAEPVHSSFARILERENAELQNEVSKLCEQVAHLECNNNAIMAELIEAMDDKARLDWLQSSDITLHHWVEGGIWAKSGMYTIRECIDREMEEKIREKEAGNHI